LRRLTVLVGGNGVGKTNLYRALELLSAAATGRLSSEIAREGGLGSVFWAGGRNLTEDGSFDPRYRTNGYRSHEKRRLLLEVEVQFDELNPTYCVELGFPPPGSASFPLEAWVKAERLELRTGKRPTLLLDRDGPVVHLRDDDGRRQTIENAVLSSETALANLRGAYPELDAVRSALSAWRFFHGFRSDTDSPLRRPTRAVTAVALDPDGGNLAAVFATLRHIRQDTVDLDAAIAAAFPGAILDVPVPGEYAEFGVTFPDTPKRSFRAHELSDGTLQFLALLGALLSYRPPLFIALNEPETSLHPDVLPALARFIVKCAERSQVWVVTHSTVLAGAIAELSGITPLTVERRESATLIAGLSRLGFSPEE
jgi:predicted ATPase